MRSKRSDWRYRAFLIAGILLLPFVCYQAWGLYKMDRDGVYIKCIVTRIYEQKKRGKLVSIVYMFNGKKYTSEERADIETRNTGRQFFLKVLPDEPKRIIFFESRPVPDCLLNMQAPRGGWKTIPVCNEGH